ncbi:MAG: sulfatase-like hydrolase/transferase, partial [bacterium]|nr:sulfatase-like hydrolase/transferase [bacterium]
TRNLRPAMNAASAKWLAPRRAASARRLMYTSPVPAELTQTAWFTDLGIDFIRRHMKEHADRPFFCNISYVDPHDPYDPSEPYASMYKPEDMPDPIPMAAPHYESRILEESRDFVGSDKLSPVAMRQLRALYHGSIRMIDDNIGRLVKYLEENGLADNTIICFTTDHGDMMCDHGFMTKGVKHYDTGIRVPLVAWGAGVQKGGASARLTSSLDIFPTLCEWAGAPMLPPVEGKSFAGEAAAVGSDEGWDVVTVQAPQAQVRSIVTADGWRFTVIDEAGQGQLFNLREDPREQHDLYKNPAWAAKRLELHEKLTRAYMDSSQVQQYRNLPAGDEGRGLVLHDLSGPVTPTFQMEPL